MEKSAEYAFRTKTGRCTITPEQIVLTRQGERGEAAERAFGNSILRALLIYSLLGIGALGLGVWALLVLKSIGGVFFCFLGIFFLWSVVASRNNSAATVIDRVSVKSVEAYPPHPPVTRGYFTVLFEEGGKERKRLIMLPGSMENGSEEYQRAEAVMEESGLLPTFLETPPDLT